MSHSLTKMAFAMILSLVALASLSVAVAMSVNPIVVDLDAAGRGTTAQINVTNTQAVDLPVELQVSRVDLDETGASTIIPGGAEDFIIFPPQALIPPGQTQVFRLQWVGAPDLAQSQSYIFTVAQLPVELPEGTSGIQLLYNFQVVVNVAPQDGTVALGVVSTGITTDEDALIHPTLTVRNTGNEHAYLSQTKLRLKQVDASGRTIWSQTYEPEDIGQSIGVGLVQPGRQRTFIFPAELPSASGTIEVNLRYEDR